ncbi:MAG: hypothetical protein J5675_00085 [Bacteroidales bacterium]|nr:hypothetical protein [Bacteroidales bacterium]
MRSILVDLRFSSPDGTNVLTISSENDLGQPTVASSGGVRRTYAYTAHGYPTSRELDPMPQLQTRSSNDRQIIIQKLWTTFDPHTGNLTQRVNALYGPSVGPDPLRKNRPRPESAHSFVDFRHKCYIG